MIAAVALTFAVAAVPSREALIERWLHADRMHTVARLNSAPRAPVAGGAAPADLHALAARELSIAGRYQIANPVVATSEPWWARAWRWLHDRWERFWQKIFGRIHVGRAQAASIGDVLLVLLALLLMFAAARLLVNLQLARDRSRADSVPLVERPSPRALYNHACNAASRGDYGTAALLLFAATVELLERRGAVDDATRSATVGDLRRTLRARNAALIVPFDAVAAPFVQRAYAERGVDEPQWQRARDAFDGLLAARREAISG